MNEDKNAGVEAGAKDRPSWLQWVAVIAVTVFFVIVIIGAVSNWFSNRNTTTSAPAQQAASTQFSSPCANFAKSSATSSIAYKELDKDPAAYNGTNVVYTGQVVQIQQSPGGSGVMRLSITKEDYGWSLNDIVYVTYSGGTKAVQDDIVKVYGQLTGSQTYTSQANYQITIPSMDACEIDDQTQAQATQTPAAPASLQPVRSAPAVTTPSPQPTPVAQTPPPVPKSWHTVTTFSGSAKQNTSPFAIQGSEWKIDWTANIPAGGYCEQYGCDMYIGINNTAGGIADDIMTPNLTANGSGNSYEYSGPGTFYFSIDPGDISLWTVTVEDYY